MAGDESTSELTSIPSLIPLTVSTPPEETVVRDYGKMDVSIEVVGASEDLNAIVGTPSYEASSSSFIVETPTVEGSPEVVGVPSVVGTPCSEGNYSFDFDSPVVETPISKGKDKEYVPDTPDMRNIGEARGGTTPFLTSAKQLESLVSEINRTSCCRAPGCDGELRLKNVELVRMGGDGKAHFYCSGKCGTRDICLPFSEYHEESKQTVVSFALQVAFICSGGNYAQYETVLGSMGMHPVSDHNFYETIKLMEGPTTELLDKQCEIAKEEMKKAPSGEIGSWDRAVTVADGAWMTRGHHSQNFTFHVRDYVRNSVLYYKHYCQRGKGGPLYEGTSKSMEGKAAEESFAKMKEEGMNVSVHWQDADSTAEHAVKKFYGNVTKPCGGHYTRAHFNQLKKIKGFSAGE